jgi:hypothetical protein
MPSHFDRYFGYRRLYVDAILERAPRRAVLAVVSELARLGFAVTSCALIAAIAWALTAGAFGRARGALWGVVFAIAALGVTLLGLRAFVGVVQAASDMGRVRRLVRAAGAGRGPA